MFECTDASGASKRDEDLGCPCMAFFVGSLVMVKCVAAQRPSYLSKD